MKKEFEFSKWIWNSTNVTEDSYAEFVSTFTYKGDGKIFLDLSFDSICNVYLNGRLIYFKQCADYPFYKIYDRIDITDYCKDGENDIEFFVWYLGEDSSVYYKSTPGLIFEIWDGGELVLASNEGIFARTDIRYKQNYKKNITHQLGYSFYFDNAVNNDMPYSESCEVNKDKCLALNPLKQLKISYPSESKVISSTKSNILCDLGQEYAGFLSLVIVSDTEQTVKIAYGEHIKDGNVRQIIGDRDFSAEVHLKKGNNIYTNYFRRIAGRYLSVYFEEPIEVHYLGIIPVIYPTEKKPFIANSELQQRIYDVSVRTLELCMHEHYEDCPWREQALYVMDSRNQMLCGYYAFGEYEYARHNLVLISKGLKDNGLLELTYPAKDTPAIPFFSLIYPIAVYEYIHFSKDNSILDEVASTIKSIVNVFSEHISENGLLCNLPYPFWNFYEWADGSHNGSEITRTADEPYKEQYDLILNCAYLLSVKYCNKLLDTNIDTSKTKGTVRENFFDGEIGLFRATLGEDFYTELGNSLAVLSGICTEQEERVIVGELMKDGIMRKITLSMQCFKYDALLKVSTENSAYVIADIEKNYGYMLKEGATSVWETIVGESDFDGAGSLCHGWSAMPVYYLKMLK